MLTLTDVELFRLFERPTENIRWMASAESSEYLNIITYLCWRNTREAA